ncbi:MAG: hypothetical protein ACYCX3_06250 [Thermoleophilia bacterium]
MVHEPDADLSSTVGSCADPGCHVLNIAAQHDGDTFKDGTVGSCATCHSTAAPQYAKDAIAAWKTTGIQQDCFVCHGANAGQHVQQHELVASDCSLCHSNNLVTEHTVNNPLGCDECHGAGASPTVKLVIATYGGANPALPLCTSCHTAYHDGAMAKHTANEGTDCKSCHQMMLPDEHARSTSISNSRSCGNCHPLPGSFVWTYTCADCHETGGLAPVRHLAENTKHVSSQTDCAKSGCHSSDLKSVHSVVGCNVCHSTTNVPTSSDCRTCHTDGMHHDVAPTFKFGTTSSANIRQACETACHEHDWTHQSGQDCWGRCHGPGKQEDFHTVESDHQQSSACAKCHNASTAQANACRTCHSFGSNWWAPYGTTTTTSPTTTTTNTTVPPATTEYMVSRAVYLEGLSNNSSDSRAARATDLTSRMGDGSNSNSYEIRRDQNMMSLQLDQSGASVSAAVLRLYVTQLGGSWWGSSSQTIRIYRYQSDGSSVSSSYRDFTVSSTGWISLDVTGLAQGTSGSSFKLRVTCNSDRFYLSEARYLITR